MNIQSAIAALTPMAEAQLFAVALLPYALIAALGLGCAFAIAASAAARHRDRNGDGMQDEDRR